MKTRLLFAFVILIMFVGVIPVQAEHEQIKDTGK